MYKTTQPGALKSRLSFALNLTALSKWVQQSQVRSYNRTRLSPEHKGMTIELRVRILYNIIIILLVACASVQLARLYFDIASYLAASKHALVCLC